MGLFVITVQRYYIPPWALCDWMQMDAKSENTFSGDAKTRFGEGRKRVLATGQNVFLIFPSK
jgi:hypothetical protein